MIQRMITLVKRKNEKKYIEMKIYKLQHISCKYALHKGHEIVYIVNWLRRKM